MSNKMILKTKLNELNTAFWEQKTQMQKNQVSPSLIARLTKVRKELADKLVAEFGDDLDKLNNGQSITIKRG